MSDPLDAAAVTAAVRPHGDGAAVQVRVVVRAPRTRVAGRYGDALKVRVAAPPVDGAANEELCRYVAGLAGVRPGDVSVVAGARARDKVVVVAGMGVDELRKALRGT